MSVRLKGRWPPHPALLVGEALLYVAGVMTFLHVAFPSKRVPIAVHVICWALIIGTPILLDRLHGWGPRDGGIRLDNLRPALKQVVLPTLLMLAVVVVIGFAVQGWHADPLHRTLRRLGKYMVFGPAQQFLLCGWILPRLERAGVRPPVAAVAASLLFGLAHAPNAVLMLVTAGAGVVWCRLFQRVPNVLALGWAQGVLATVIRQAWPESWLVGMRVGGNFIDRAG